MTDIVDRETRSRMMAGIRSKNTSPEIAVRQYLHREGFRFRLHVRSLPGCPDIVLPRYRTIILVNGCFWHRHQNCPLAYFPKSNPEKWQAKFDQNVKRDQKNLRDLEQSGWRVIILWECGLRNIKNDTLKFLPGQIRNSDRPTLTEWPVL